MVKPNARQLEANVVICTRVPNLCGDICPLVLKAKVASLLLRNRACFLAERDADKGVHH